MMHQYSRTLRLTTFCALFVDLVSMLPKEDLRSNTWSFELFYNYQLTPWLHLTPSIQYAQNQNKQNDPAFIPGLRLVMDF